MSCLIWSVSIRVWPSFLFLEAIVFVVLSSPMVLASFFMFWIHKALTFSLVDLIFHVLYMKVAGKFWNLKLWSWCCSTSKRTPRFKSWINKILKQGAWSPSCSLWFYFIYICCIFLVVWCDWRFDVVHCLPNSRLLSIFSSSSHTRSCILRNTTKGLLREWSWLLRAFSWFGSGNSLSASIL